MTKEIMNWLLEQKSPFPNFGYKVSESPDGIFITVALEEFAKFSGPQQEMLAVWVGGLVSYIRKQGVPCYLNRVDNFNESSNL